jgi:hypothetical protein
MISVYLGYIFSLNYNRMPRMSRKDIPKPITHFKIYGERCSGTYLLEDTICKNFEINYWHHKKYGHKHFLHSIDFTNSDDTLFICIIRHPIKWMNSLYRTPHHLPQEMCMTPETFTNHEVTAWTYNPLRMVVHCRRNQAPELKDERNPFTGEIYKNIYEMRHVKNKWMIEELPKLVKNHILIRYEDLVNDFQETMQKIKEKGLKQKDVTHEIEDMKVWMKERGDEDVDEKNFQFVQINPNNKVRKWMKNSPCDELNIKAGDIPKEYHYYEKILGYF